ncbi:MAG: Nudix family hydrolase [Gammaproteobacteria bacterium]
MPSPKVQHVAAAVVVNSAGEVLLALRPPEAHQGGLWEFPGGKVEAGEDIRCALARELYEELGITVETARPLIRVHHDYADKSVLLDVWRVDAFAGQPHGREGQQIEWVAPERLLERAYPAANWPIVTAARLPPLYLITPEPRGETGDFLRALEQSLLGGRSSASCAHGTCASLRGGIRLVQLRAKTLAGDDYKRLAEQSLHLCRRYQAQLVLNAPYNLALELGADGVHLDSARLMTLDERPLARDLWVAASCHNATELAHAYRIGVDFAVVSPVLETASHPGAQTLGWAGLRALTEQTTVPVYALGGMTPGHLPQAWAHGAQGIAAIGALWGSDCNQIM